MATMREPEAGLRLFGWQRKAVIAFRTERIEQAQQRTEAWRGAVTALESDLAVCQEQLRLRAAALAQAQTDTARLRQWVELSRASLGWLRRGAEAEVRRVRIDHEQRLEQWGHQKAEMAQVASAAADVLRVMLDDVASVLHHLPPWLSEGPALGPRVMHCYVGDADAPLRIEDLSEDRMRLTTDRLDMVVTDQAGERGRVQALLLTRESLALQALEVRTHDGTHATVPIANVTGVHAEGITVSGRLGVVPNDATRVGGWGDGMAGEPDGDGVLPTAQVRRPSPSTPVAAGLGIPAPQVGGSSLNETVEPNRDPLQEAASDAMAPGGSLGGEDAPLPGLEGMVASRKAVPDRSAVRDGAGEPPEPTALEGSLGGEDAPVRRQQGSGQADAPPEETAVPVRGAGDTRSETLLGDDVLHYLVGKLVGQELRDAQGKVIAHAGDVIDVAVVHAAEVAGLLPELIVHMTLPGVRG